MKLSSLSKYVLTCCLSFFALVLIAKEPPNRPIPPKLVNDFAGILNANERANLERKLTIYNDTTSTQIAIVLENSLEGDEVFDYSFRLAEKWGIGQKDKDNGILIYAAMQDRKIFIHVGPGLQGKVTDNLTRSIIETIIIPNFRNQSYYGGLDRATDAIIQFASGEFKNDGKRSKPQTEFPYEILIFLAILILIMYLNRNDDDDDGGGYYRGGRYDYDRPHRRGRRGGGGFIFFPGGGGGGGGGGFGGGGFGGFGGGGFDGGGAGGSW